MEKQIPPEPRARLDSNIQGPSHVALSDFNVGNEVIYGLHGRCRIMAIESRELSGETRRLFRLEITRSNLSRSSRKEPAIWLPVESAISQGMRHPMSAAQAGDAILVLLSREHYLELTDSWSSLQTKLEQLARKEGSVGLAKVFSFLYVYLKQQVVPSSEVTRIYDHVHKLLFTELSVALGSARTSTKAFAAALRNPGH
jgi:RNA polymerase-interacting CarD/CdnL/TRCF family regulator